MLIKKCVRFLWDEESKKKSPTLMWCRDMGRREDNVRKIAVSPQWTLMKVRFL